CRTVEQAFTEEQPRLLPHPIHPIGTDRIVPVRSAKTIYVRFDLNDYSIPPEAVGRQLTLVASDCSALGDARCSGHGPSLTAGDSRRPPCAPGSCQTGPAGSVPRPGPHGSFSQ